MKVYVRKNRAYGQWVLIETGATIGFSFVEQPPDRNDRRINVIDLGDGMKIEGAAGSGDLIITEA